MSCQQIVESFVERNFLLSSKQANFCGDFSAATEFQKQYGSSFEATRVRFHSLRFSFFHLLFGV